MRLVFDTSVLVSACIYPDRLPATIYLTSLAHFSVLSSTSTLKELRTVLARPKFDAWRSAEERRIWFENYAACTDTIAVTTRITDCQDPKDNLFLELAVSGGASVIVSSDPHLLDMHPYNDIQILTLQTFKANHLDPLP